MNPATSHTNHGHGGDTAASAPDAVRAATARAMAARLNQLAAALMVRGLKVRIGEDTVVARNPAASVTGDPLGRSMHPGLSQEVAVTAHDDGTLHFHWCWSGATRDAPRELEYMTPADDIDGAAEKVARVLAVGDG